MSLDLFGPDSCILCIFCAQEKYLEGRWEKSIAQALMWEAFLVELVELNLLLFSNAAAK